MEYTKPKIESVESNTESATCSVICVVVDPRNKEVHIDGSCENPYIRNAL